jgi:uncharacterized protein
MIEGYVRFILAHRMAATCLVAFVVGSLLVCWVTLLKVDISPESFFIEGDETVTNYDAFKSKFVSDEFVFIDLAVGPKWDADKLSLIAALERDLLAIDSVLSALSAISAKRVVQAGSAISVTNAIPTDPTGEQISEAVAFLTRDTVYKDRIITRDGSHTAIILKTAIKGGEYAYKARMSQDIADVLAKPAYQALSPVLVGAPILDTKIRAALSADSAKLGAATFVLICLGLIIILRSAAGVVLAVVIAGCTVVITFGVMAILRFPVTLLTPIIPSFVMSVCITGPTYLAIRFERTVRGGASPNDALIEVARTTGIAVIISSLTTAGALFAFSGSQIRPVSELGLTLGVSISVSTALTCVMAPVLGSTGWRWGRTRQDPNRGGGTSAIDWMLARLSGLTIRRPQASVIFVLVGLVPICIGLSRVNFDYYYLGIFRENSDVRSAYRAIEKLYGATSTIEIMVKKKDGSDVLNYPDLSAIRVFASAIERLPAGYATDSLIQLIDQFDGGEEGCSVAPHSGACARFWQNSDKEIQHAVGMLGLLKAFGTDLLKDYVSADKSTARVTVRLPTLSDKANRAYLSELQQLAQSPQFSQWQIEFTGLVALWTRLSEYLMDSQIQSIAVAFIVVLLALMLVARSALIGLIVSLTNVIAVVFVLSLLGWAGIALDPYSLLVGAVAIGILDDDAIHFLYAIRKAFTAGDDIAEAIRYAYKTVGFTMCCTTSILVLGFSVYFLSSIVSLNKFGLLMIATLLAGLVLQLTLSPAVIHIVYRWRR